MVRRASAALAAVVLEPRLEDSRATTLAAVLAAVEALRLVLVQRKAKEVLEAPTRRRVAAAGAERMSCFD